MAEQKKVKDASRAIEGKDLIARARKRARVKLAWMALGWGVLILFVVFLWRCLSDIFEYQAQTEVPISAPAGEEAPAEAP